MNIRARASWYAASRSSLEVLAEVDESPWSEEASDPALLGVVEFLGEPLSEGVRRIILTADFAGPDTGFCCCCSGIVVGKSHNCVGGLYLVSSYVA